jgi:phosphomannomutase
VGIFKAYDIRGVVDGEFNPQIARKIANAMVQYLGAKKIIVMRDMRIHSEAIAAETVAGVLDAGCDVLDAGFGTTPMSYYLNGRVGCDGSMMVTASHNPAKYNGFKLCRGNAVPMSLETGIGEIQKIYESGKYVLAKKPGRVEKRDFSGEYVERMLTFARGVKPLNIAVDSANGATGPFILKIFKKLPCKLSTLYMEPDGRFPNHEANPLKSENLVDLQKLMKKTGAELGIALDGDGDRARFLDEKGEPVASDLITTLIALEMIREYPGTHVIYDLRSSWVLPEKVKEAGGVPVRERVGHSFMKITMRKVDGAFGGELSGHYYFKENYFSDSGILATLKILNILSNTGKKLSELIKPLKKYHSTGEINFTVKDQDAKIREVEKTFPGGKVDYLDGVTIQFDDWWMNVRKSNTEPILRLNLEAKTKKLMDEKKAAVIKIIGEPE